MLGPELPNCLVQTPLQVHAELVHFKGFGLDGMNPKLSSLKKAHQGLFSPKCQVMWWSIYFRMKEPWPPPTTRHGEKKLPTRSQDTLNRANRLVGVCSVLENFENRHHIEKCSRKSIMQFFHPVLVN